MATITVKGLQAVTVKTIDDNWLFSDTYPRFVNSGISLKGIVLIPGSGAPDTFAIKDGGENGAYLYSQALSAAAVIVLDGVQCNPYIDNSECTLSAGHMITFLW